MSAQSQWGAFLFGCFLLVASPCWAANVQPVQGNLYINRGQGFQPVAGPVDANIGDSVMVAPGGIATIIYPDGCKFGVQPGTVTTIAPSSPCTSPYAGQQPFPPQQPVAQGDPPYNSAFALGATGAALGAIGIGVAIYALTKKNSNDYYTVGNTCGSAADPCYYKISP